MVIQGMLSKWVFGAFAVLLLTSAPLDAASAADRIWRLGWLDLNAPPPNASGKFNLQRFLEGMRDLGYVEKRDFVIEARFGDTDRDRLPDLAKELVNAGVDMIVTVGTPTTVAAKQATSTIPIIMTGAENPIGYGLIASYAHPGSNVTGLTHNPGAAFSAKGLQLLRQTVPGINRLAVLKGSEHLFDVSDAVGLAVSIYPLTGVRNLDDLRAIFSKILEDRADALFLSPDFVIGKYPDEISDFIISNRIPAMSQHSALIVAGRSALLYYYTDFGALRRRAAAFVDKIIKGAMPAELPVEEPSKFEFVVNLKTARALGLTIPQSIIAFADRVIE
jgi:putative ABC transport system substrate-binding protein